MFPSCYHGCQMAIARFLDHMCLALWASGLWLRYATLQNLIPSFPWIAPPRPPPWRNPRKGRDQILRSGNLAQGPPAARPSRGRPCGNPRPRRPGIQFNRIKFSLKNGLRIVFDSVTYESIQFQSDFCT